MRSSIVSVSGGLPGPKGETGDPGIDGKTLLNGIVDPTSGVGVDGDFYINTEAKTIFGPKASGSWPSGTSIIGPTGLSGADGKTILNGIVDPTSGDGVDGDFYINTNTEMIFGPKASGVWPSGVSLKGADGTYRDVTISTESPTGIPSTGALWFQVEV